MNHKNQSDTVTPPNNHSTMNNSSPRLVQRGFACLIVICLSSASQLWGQPTSSPTAPVPLQAPRDVSFANEIERAIDRGLEFLLSKQNKAGWWSTADHPAVTGLSLSAFLGHPRDRYRTNLPPTLRKGLQFLAESAKPDGRIYRTSLANYNTAISALALSMSGDPVHAPIVQNARRHLASAQIDQGKPGEQDSPFDGGVGYNDKYEHSDLNNTLVALETLYYTRRMDGEKPEDGLDWEAAIAFIQNCQNLPSHNSQPWVSDAPEDKGGFVYFPGDSKAGGTTNAVSGKVALRSYGSISYAGLLSYIYADLDPADPRVAAVLKWLQQNFTLEENPAMGLQGYYYYLHLMSKALASLELNELQLEDGTTIDWRRALAMRLINLQQTDGSWSNSNGRWWESDPVLVTAYAVMTLEIIHRRL